jgi:hypothetical protein
MKSRKAAVTINSVNQQNLKRSNDKVKSNQQATQPGKKAIETQESVHTS